MTRKADFSIGVGTTLLAICIYLSANQLPVVEIGLGAGGFPKFIAIALGVMGIILAIKSFYRMRQGDQDVKKLELKELINVAILAASFALYVFVVRYLGYLITTPLFFFLFMLIYGERKWIKMGIISVSFTLVVYFLFEKIFYIILPHGILF